MSAQLCHVLSAYLMNGMHCEIISCWKKCWCKRTSFFSLLQLYWKRRNDFEFNSINLRSSKLLESAHRLLVFETNLLGTLPAVYTRHGQEQIQMSVPWNVILNGFR